MYFQNISRRCKVIGLEYYQSLVDYSIDNITNHYNHLLKYKSRFKIIEGSGWFGYPKKLKKENMMRYILELRVILFPFIWFIS